MAERAMARVIATAGAYRPALVISVLYIALAAWFCGVYFPLHPAKLAAPGDMQAVSAVHWFIAKTVVERWELPLWNPYVLTGVPFIGDPYYPINPLLIVPYALFGPINGAKVAAIGAVALAGIGQYWLSRVLGHARAIAAVAGVVGLSAGSLTAQLATGFSPIQAQQHAWLAATLASYIVALRCRQPGWIALSIVCYAFLYLAGHLLYFEILSVVLVLFTLSYAVSWAGVGSKPWLMVDWSIVRIGLLVAITTFLLIASQVVPTIDLRFRTEKPMDIGFNGTQPPLATLFNFVVADRRFWVRGIHDAMGWELHYSYLGGGLFLFLMFLVPAYLRRPTRDLPPLLAGGILAIAWASARHTFMFEIWKRFDGMRLISFQAMAVAVATVLLIPLALAGADYLWRLVLANDGRWERIGPTLRWEGGSPANAHDPRRVWTLSLTRLAAWVVLAGVLWNTARDPWTVNRTLWHQVPYFDQLDQLYRWVRNHDRSAFTVAGHEMSLSTGVASIAQFRYEVPVLTSPWRLQVLRPRTPGQPNEGRFTPAPKYVLAPADKPGPDGATLLAALPAGAIYTAPPGLPFAFLADPQLLPYGDAAAGAHAVASGLVREAPARFDGPNRIAVAVPNGAAPSMNRLVVMQSFVPGWRANSESGRALAVDMAGGYLSIANVAPGETVILSYFPASFVVGMALTAVGLVMLAVLSWIGLFGCPAWLRTLGGKWHVGRVTDRLPNRGQRSRTASGT